MITDARGSSVDGNKLTTGYLCMIRAARRTCRYVRKVSRCSLFSSWSSSSLSSRTASTHLRPFSTSDSPSASIHQYAQSCFLFLDIPLPRLPPCILLAACVSFDLIAAVGCGSHCKQGLLASATTSCWLPSAVTLHPARAAPNTTSHGL